MSQGAGLRQGYGPAGGGRNKRFALDVDLVDGDLYDRLHGGWFGRCVGQGGRNDLTTENISHLVGLESFGLDYSPDSPPDSPDLWAFVYPGRPDKAVELALRNADGPADGKRVSYACLAAMVSSAFALTDVREIVDIGVRLAGADRGAFDPQWQISEISKCLLDGAGDFCESLRLAGLGSAVAGSVGCVLGVMLESQGIPDAAKRDLEDRIGNPVEGGTTRISELGRRTLEVVRTLGTNP